MKTICPACKGKGGGKIPSSHPLHVYKIDGPVIYETYICETCKGAGEISRLHFAVYKARGGSAPPVML